MTSTYGRFLKRGVVHVGKACRWSLQVAYIFPSSGSEHSRVQPIRRVNGGDKNDESGVSYTKHGRDLFLDSSDSDSFGD